MKMIRVAYVRFSHFRTTGAIFALAIYVAMATFHAFGTQSAQWAMSLR